MDVIQHVQTASGLGNHIVGPWIRRVFVPDGSFDDLSTHEGVAPRMHALGDLSAEVQLNLLENIPHILIGFQRLAQFFCCVEIK